MEPEDPTIVAEWLARSQNDPLAVIAEFTDTYKHLYICSYRDSTTATLADSSDFGACLCRNAVLSPS